MHASVRDGGIGLDSARAIVGLLQSVRKPVMTANGKLDGLRSVAAAEGTLVGLARIESPEELKLHLERGRDVLDPDGAGTPPTTPC